MVVAIEFADANVRADGILENHPIESEHDDFYGFPRITVSLGKYRASGPPDSIDILGLQSLVLDRRYLLQRAADQCTHTATTLT